MVGLDLGASSSRVAVSMGSLSHLRLAGSPPCPAQSGTGQAVAAARDQKAPNGLTDQLGGDGAIASR